MPEVPLMDIRKGAVHACVRVCVHVCVQADTISACCNNEAKHLLEMYNERSYSQSLVGPPVLRT